MTPTRARWSRWWMLLAATPLLLPLVACGTYEMTEIDDGDTVRIRSSGIGIAVPDLVVLYERRRVSEPSLLRRRHLAREPIGELREWESSMRFLIWPVAPITLRTMRTEDTHVGHLSHTYERDGRFRERLDQAIADGRIPPSALRAASSWCSCSRYTPMQPGENPILPLLREAGLRE